MRRTNLLALTLLLLLCTVSQGAFKFVAWADNRPYDSGNRERFRWMLGQMNVIVGSEPLFHVVPGDYDYTYMTNDDIRDFSDIKTWYEAIGNHDRDAGETKGNESKDLPSGTPQALFLFLNEYQCPSTDPKSVHDCWEGRVCSHALDWLKLECQSAPTGFPIFVVGHEPAYPENAHVGNSLDLYPTERDAFWALLGQYEATYICGHTHYYSTYSFGGATQIDVGNAGNPGESHQTFVVFEVDGSDVSYTAYRIDYNVSVSPKASNLNPEDEATNVPVDTVLSWIAGINAVSHDVYLGENFDDVNDGTGDTFRGNQTATIFNPGTMDYETTYYWRIDEFVDSSTTHRGDVWSFTTEVFVPPLPWSDDFESGSFAAGGWTTSGNASASSKAAYSGTYGAEIKGTAWIEKAVSTVGFSNINIKYFRKTKGLDDGEYLYVEWFDGNSWNPLEDTFSTSWSPHQDLTCGESANENADFKVRFRTNASNSAEYAYVDDVEISTSSEPVHDHDVAVMAITAPSSAIQGDVVSVNVTVQNVGNQDVTSDISVTLTDDTDAVIIGTQIISGVLAAGDSTTLTYSWDTSSATIDAHSLTASHYFADDNASNDSKSTTVTVSVAPAGPTMHVGGIAFPYDTRTQKGNTYAKVTATVTILDASGGSVGSATVYATWSGEYTGEVSGSTTGEGKVTFRTGWVQLTSDGTFTLTVNSVTKDRWTFDPTNNSDSITIPY